jgi:IS30 family transposase
MRLGRNPIGNPIPIAISISEPGALLARQQNERPRKKLEFETPAEKFNTCVASIG